MHSVEEESDPTSYLEAFKTIFDLSPDPKMIIRNGKFIECNIAAAYIMRASSKMELLRINPATISPQRQPDGQESVEKARQLFETAYSEGVVRFDWVYTRFDGSDLFVEVTLTRIGSPDEKLLYAHWRDMSGQLAIERKLDFTRRRFKEIAEISSDWVWEIDASGQYTYVSDKVKTFLGFTPKEIIGKTPFDLMPPEEASRIKEILIDYANQQHPFKDIDNINLHKDGREVILRTSGVPIFDSEGNFAGYRGADKDITREQHLIKSLERSQSNLREAQELANIGHWELDLSTNDLHWSDQVYRIFGLQPQEVPATYEAFMTYVHPDDRELVDDTYSTSVKQNSTYQITHRIISSDGTLKYVEERCEHEVDGNGNVIRSLGTVQDITEQVQYKKQLQLASLVFTHSTNAIIITDKNNHIITINKAAEQLTGYSEAEVVGKNPKVLGTSTWGDKTFYENMWNEIITHGFWQGEIWDRKKNGDIYIAAQVIIAVKDEHGQIENFIGISSDVTELVREQEEKQHALTTSPFGGLKNRSVLLQDLEHYDISCAAVIDVNGFHQINGFYGYAFSDQLLNEISTIIKSRCDGMYQAYHLHADSFVITMSNEDDKPRFFKAIEDVLDIIENTTFKIDEYALSVSVTGVIANAPSDTLLRALDMALKHAKAKHLKFWVHDDTSDLSAQFRDNLHWIKELKSAFKEDRVTVFFQPIYAFESSQIERYEALVRIIGNDGEIITPNFFLAAAEQSNQMFQLTETVFLKTLEMLKKCDGHYSFSVNISSSDMLNPDFLELIKTHLHDFSMAQKICFEVLETQDITDIDAIVHFVETVQQLGCMVAIDDFGSGFANFENLIKLDIDIIKIDGSLIEKIATHQDAYDIVDAIVSFAQKRKIKTVAEFVRNRLIFDVAKKLGIDYVQGYYIAKPQQSCDYKANGKEVDVTEPYKLLIYVSTANNDTTYEMATHILNTSWENNRKNGIGGVLLYDKTHFVQMLNGPTDRVDQVFQRITNDERHSNIRLIGEEVMDTQELDEWNMGFLPKSNIITEIFKKHHIEEDDGLYNAPFTDLKALLKELTLYI